MNNFDCNKCTHKNVCYYKEQIPKYYDDIESDSMFELTLSCKEYKEEKSVPTPFDPPIIVPYNYGWATSTDSQETECEAYRTYLERVKNTNFIGDSPCSYCAKPNCPRSHVIYCSNANTATSIR